MFQATPFCLFRGHATLQTLSARGMTKLLVRRERRRRQVVIMKANDLYRSWRASLRRRFQFCLCPTASKWFNYQSSSAARIANGLRVWRTPEFVISPMLGSGGEATQKLLCRAGFGREMSPQLDIDIQNHDSCQLKQIPQRSSSNRPSHHLAICQIFFPNVIQFLRLDIISQARPLSRGEKFRSFALGWWIYKSKAFQFFCVGN